MFDFLARAQALEAAGEKVLHFELGDSDFASPASAVRALGEAVTNGHTKYTNSMGVMALREQVVAYTDTHYKFSPTIDQVSIAPANTLLDFTIKCCADPGDEIILPDPCFPTYTSVLGYLGIKAVGVPLRQEQDFRLCPEDVEKAITDRTKMIILNSPNNPTGGMSTPDDVKRIYEIAEKHDLFILSDEVYARMTYQETHASPVTFDKCQQRTILLMSMSKMFAMSGWRVGFAVLPSHLNRKIGLMIQTTLSCLPAFTQIAAAAALSEEPDFIDDMMQEYKIRRDVLIDGLNGLPGVSCLTPKGAFYAFPKIELDGFSETEYADRLLTETGVCVVPGSCFGQAGRGHIRMAFGGTDLSMIDNALTRLTQFHKAHT